MPGQITARFLVDHPIRPGMVRAILDTLTAQGGAYEPQLVRRSSSADLRRITWSRPAGLLDEVAQGGTRTTFLRVAEGQPRPVLAFSISATPRSRPSLVTLTVPEEALASSQEIERVLGVCKGLYLFLESPWGAVGMGSDSATSWIRWANFFGPQVVTHVGPARLLTSMAFIVEILPDGGMMLVTHPTPGQAETTEGQALRAHLEATTGLRDTLQSYDRSSPRAGLTESTLPVRVRRTRSRGSP
jgi:hypothetical protein